MLRVFNNLNRDLLAGQNLGLSGHVSAGIACRRGEHNNQPLGIKLQKIGAI